MFIGKQLYPRFLTASYWIGLVLLAVTAVGQTTTLTVLNPSFEGPSMPHVTPAPWNQCAGSPDTQPGQWGFTQPPSDGISYISFLQSGSAPGGYYEGSSQQLSSPMVAGVTYSFTLDLAHSPVYNTASPGNCYSTLEIWGGFGPCGMTQSLWQSPIITHTNWQTYTITFTPLQNFTHISLRPYWSGACSGYINIMIDNMSSLCQPWNLNPVISNASCGGQPTGSITLNPDGVSPFTYEWGHTSSTSNTVTNLAPGTYSVTVTDNDGCVKDTTIAITPTGNSVLITFNVTGISCSGANDASITAQLSLGIPPFTWQWSTGNDSTLTLTNLGPGTYILDVDDSSNCASIDSVVIVDPGPVNDSIAAFLYPNGFEISCYGASDGSIDLTVTGGTPPYTFSWNNGAYTTEDLANIPAGVYDVVITDTNGCTGSSSITLTQPPPMDLGITATVYSQGYNITCNGGSDGQVDLTVSGGASPYAYSWNGGAYITEDLSNVPAGLYVVTVTDAGGCSLSDSITLTEPLVITTGITSLTYWGGWNVSCNGLSDGNANLTVGGGAPPYSYSWNGGAYTTEDLNNIPAGTYIVDVTDANGCVVSDTIVLTEPAAMADSLSTSLYTGGVNISCNGGNDGFVGLNVTGGQTPYTYNWNNGAYNTQNLNSVMAGTYQVVVTDVNGCTITNSVTLTEPAALATTLVPSLYNGYNISCNGLSDGSVDLTVTGGTQPYTYSWNNGAFSTEDLSNIPAGIYKLTVTDANNCSTTASINMTQPVVLGEFLNPATYVGGWNISCNGLTDGSVNLIPSGGVQPLSYSWNNGTYTTEDLSNVGAGTYVVTITDANNCAIADTIILTEPPALTSVMAPTVHSNGLNITCNGLNDGMINLTVNGGTPSYTYNWNNGSYFTEDMGNIPAGQYTVSVTDANGCAILDTVTLTQPPALSTATLSSTYNGGWNISCHSASDGSVDLSVSGGNGAPYTYSWNNGNYTTEDLNNVPAGIYNLQATDATGCITTLQVTLTEPAQLITNVNPQTYTGGWNISCNGYSDGQATAVVSGGTPNYTYSWNTGSVSNSISNVAAGSYSVTVTDANGCQTVNNIVLTEPTPLNASISGENLTCFEGYDGQAQVDVSGGSYPYFYDWNFSNGIDSIETGLAAGSYIVTVTDANGCTEVRNIDLTQPQEIIVDALPDESKIIYGNGVTLTTIYYADSSNLSYAWSPADGLSCIDCASPIASPEVSTAYSVVVYDKNGCAAKDTIWVEVEEEKLIYVPNIFTPNGDGVNDDFRPYASGVQSAVLVVVDRWGEVMYRTQDIERGWDGTFRGQLMPPAVYAYHVEITYRDGTIKFQHGSVTLIR